MLTFIAFADKYMSNSQFASLDLAYFVIYTATKAFLFESPIDTIITKTAAILDCKTSGLFAMVLNLAHAVCKGELNEDTA